MKTIYKLLLFLLLTTNSIFCQNTAFNEAENNEITADKFYKAFAYDSAAFYYCKAADLFLQQQNWLLAAKNYRMAGNSFLKVSKKDTTLYYVQKAYDISEKHFDRNNKDEMLEKSDILVGMADVNREIALYNKALELIVETDTTANLRIVSIWNKISFAYSYSAKYDSAFLFCEKALNKILKATDENNAEISQSYCQLGILYGRTGQYDKALQYLQNSLDIRIKLYGENHPDVASIYNNIGIVYNSKSESEKALQCYRKGLQIREIIYNWSHPDLADSYNSIGTVYYKKGEYDNALEYFQKALQIRIDAFGEQNPNVASSYNNIGVIYDCKGESEKALLFYKKSLDIIIKIYGDQHPDVADGYNNIGVIYYNEGNLEEALRYFEKSLQIMIETYGSQHPDVADGYANIGIICSDNGDYNKALQYHQKALQIAIEIYGETHPLVSNCYNNLGSVYDNMKDYDKALQYYRKALELRLKVYGEIHPDVADCYNNIGLQYKEKGDYAKALEYYNKVLQIRIKLFGKLHPDLAFIYKNIGILYNLKGEYDNAIMAFQKGVMTNCPGFTDTTYFSNPSGESAFQKPILIDLLTNKAESFYLRYKKNTNSTKDLDASLSAFKSTFLIINNLRNDYNNESAKLMLSETIKDNFVEALHVAIELNRKSPSDEHRSKTFDFIENTKSATLAAELNNYSAMQFAGIPDSLLRAEKMLRNKILTLSTQITDEKYTNGGYDTIKVNALENENFAYSRRLDSLISSFETNYPDYYKMKYENKTASISEIQKALEGNTAMLNYFVGDSTIFIATITNSHYNIREINIDSTFKGLVTKYIDIETTNPQLSLSNSRYIYKTLIEPVKNEIAGKEHLVIIPDEYLYYLPFETLVENSSADTTFTGYSNLAYLIKTHSVSYHHSATLWNQSVNKAKGQDVFPNNNFIGFAPVFSKDANNGLILSENIRNMAARAGSGENRSFTSDMKYLAPLPYSKDEVVSIGKLFERQRKKAEVYLYGSASEQNFKSKAGTYKYVHIASHGFSNDQESRLSGLIFSQPDSAGRNEQTDDGILYVGETYNLKLNADLVVLSSCESGLGKLVKGEGLQALSRGFMYAGTPNIMFSLWKVIDKPTKTLMIQFYANILDGKTYPEALRLAKLSLLANPKTANPYLWGGFVLVGR